MNTGLDFESRREAIRVLNQLLSYPQMRNAVDRNVERMVATVEHRRGVYSSRIDDEHLAEFLVDTIGSDLLSYTKMRRAILESASDAQLKQLDPGADSGIIADRKSLLRKLLSKRWRYGGSFAHQMVRVFGFPIAFAGLPGISSGPPIEEVEPYKPLPPLHDYQLELHQSIVEVLGSSAQHRRALLSLPTGAGKTRTAVEAVVDWWNSSTLVKPLILWIAQSDELCDQALESFREVWIDKGGAGVRKSMRLYRVWGKHRAIPGLFASGVIIASIQKLYEMTRRGMEYELNDLSEDLAVVIVDEAHRAVGKSYTAVLRALKVLVPRFSELPAVPLLGLSATPYRGYNAEENERLVRRFRRLLVSPQLGDKPVEMLRNRGVLAGIEHQIVQTGRSFQLNDNEVRYLQKHQSFPGSFVRKVGEDPERNQLLVSTVMEFPADWPVLFFGCTVEHATAVSVMLRRQGRVAAVVTGHTRPATRRALIEAFRSGEIQVLCNYGVLTTGFDAPKINAVVISRPTASVVLYEQMIGRGMRGPLNGGTENCVVIDMADNIRRFQGQMAYARMMEQWAVD